MSGTDLEGRTAVVAGVSQGAGLATARRLGSAGARVVGIARTPPEAADPLFVRADLSTRDGVTAAAAAVAGLVGVPDIVVHVAGGSRSAVSRRAALDDLMRVLGGIPLPLWAPSRPAAVCAPATSSRRSVTPGRATPASPTAGARSWWLVDPEGGGAPG